MSRIGEESQPQLDGLLGGTLGGRHAGGRKQRYNDKTWLDYDGHPHTESLRVTEHYRRPDFGHIELEVTLGDPKAYVKPWTVAIKMELTPDTEILEMVCDNEKDRAHMPTNARGSDLHVPPETLRKYAGTYETQEGSKTHTVEVSASDDA